MTTANRNADLIAAIHRACDARGDVDHIRAGLIAESTRFDPRQQTDLIEHFRAEADLWHRASRDEQP